MSSWLKHIRCMQWSDASIQIVRVSKGLRSLSHKSIYMCVKQALSDIQIHGSCLSWTNELQSSSSIIQVCLCCQGPLFEMTLWLHEESLLEKYSAWLWFALKIMPYLPEKMRQQDGGRCFLSLPVPFLIALLYSALQSPYFRIPWNWGD